MVHSNTHGVHALVWAGCTSEESVEKVTTSTAKSGYDLVEFALHDSVNMNVQHAKALLQENNLDVVCSRGLAFDADVSSDDTATVDRGAKLLQDSLQLHASRATR